MIGAHRVLVLVLFLAGGAIRAEDSSSNRSALPDGFQTYTGVAFQFTISLPPGWSVFHQMEALTGSPGETGTSVFCSEQVDSSAQTSGDAEAMKSLLGQLSGAETGRIAAGYRANLVTADDRMQVRETWIDGRRQS